MKMWIARDKDNKLFIYKKKPQKIGNEWDDKDKSGPLSQVLPSITNEDDMFPEVLWSDEEPTEIKLVKDK